MMTAKRRLTAQEREQRRAQDRQRLRNAAEQLLTSEGALKRPEKAHGSVRPIRCPATPLA
jgi:hypothetical protein